MPALPPIIRTLTSALALLLATSVMAQTPGPTEPDAPPPTERLTYSGLLTDAGGAPLADGDRTLVFRAYATPEAARAGAAPVWEEAHAAAVAGGRFFVVLGSKTPLADDGQWYTVSVDGEAPSAPTRLAPSPGQALAPGNTLQDSYDNGAVIDVDQGRPLVFRGTPGSFYTGLQVKDLTAVFSNDELVRFRLRSVLGGATWEYRVYGSLGANGGAVPPGSFAISNSSSPGATDAFIIFPGASEDLLRLDGSTARVGSASNQAGLSVYTTPNPLDPDAGFIGFNVENDNDTGSASNWYTEDGIIHTRIEADSGGEGGFFTVANGTGGAAFAVNGNNAGGSRTTLGVGTEQSTFDDTVVGDGSVALPLDAISAAETGQEAGAANQFSGSLVPLTPGYQVLISRTLTAPSSGYVIAIASVDVQFNHTSGSTTSAAEFAVTDDCDASPTVGSASDFDISIPTASASGFYNFPASPSGLFQVGSGATTFCLVGSELSGDATSIDHQLSLLFVPTAYGTAVSNLVDSAPSSADGRDDGPVGRALTSADIATERAASIRDREMSVEA